MYNYEGEKLLDKIYKDLYNSKSVQHTRRNSDRREESIRRYMDRLERVHNKANTEHKKDLIKELYFDKYVISEEKIPSFADKEVVIAAQKKSLSRWIDYLTDENTYDKLFIPLVSESISSTGYSSQYAKNLGAPCDDEMYKDYPQPYPMGGGDTFYPRDDGFNWWIREVYEDEKMVHAYTSNYYKSYLIPPYCYVGIRFSCVLDI